MKLFLGDDLVGGYVSGSRSRNTHRESLEKDETLDDALHGVSGETEGAGEVAPLAADSGGGDASPWGRAQQALQ